MLASPVAPYIAVFSILANLALSIVKPLGVQLRASMPPSKKGEVLLLGQAEPTMVGIEIDSTTIFKTSEQSQSPPSRLRNVTEILKSDFLNCEPTNDKLVFAVPPPLFRGEARVIVLRNNFCTFTKPRPFRYPSKIRNIIKGRNNPATLPSAVNATKAYIHLFKRQICSGSQPQGRNCQRRPAAKPA